MNQKGFVKIIVIVLVLFVVVGGYLYLEKPELINKILPIKLNETANWKEYSGSTAYGEQYVFSLKYPNTWSLGPKSRGESTLVSGSCQIILGAGGRGFEGANVIKDENVVVNGAKGRTVTYVYPDIPEIEHTFHNFDKNNSGYIFEFSNPDGNQKCLSDYEGIIKTLNID